MPAPSSKCAEIHSALTMLDKNNLIKYDKRTGQVQAASVSKLPESGALAFHCRPS